MLEQYHSVATTPVKEWEVVPSVSIEVGEYLKEQYPNEQPVVMINLGAAKIALSRLKPRDAKPEIVEIHIQKEDIEIDAYPYKPQAIAIRKSWGTRIEIDAFHDVGENDTPLMLSNTDLNKIAYHESQHAADFPSDKIVALELEHEQQAEQQAARAASESSGDTTTQYSAEDTYYSSPFERRAYKAERLARRSPRIIEVSPNFN